ncbi:MAG: acetate--CoA ligase [Actinobacteria bacterium]|uniref:acetate--CoA ligase n=1 Tax=freshwater metagenome TaxID=449393 RepID=A0A6J6RLH9_9ZZZZ|nr:acetate--CoA ligase [Actinomycetota bacterium]MSY13204.1 acetate--CoA ligase [Actinomycetota bacterium]MSZ05305.1 acetate--CoA ligase [Actinomycetota bacterium]MTB06389.1 acetate--CoA ligase [Actinomycetota bacterium]
MAEKAIDDLMLENRKFPPSAAFKKTSLVTGTELYDEGNEDYQSFWARQASELVTWDKDWDTVCEWNLPYAKWFLGGQLNVSYNCLDRHVLAGRGDKVAFYWEGEPGESRVITYQQLLDEVSKFANSLKSLGVEKGDRVNIYLPMIPEAAVAMLACARIGAAHSVVFGGFSSQSLSDRINDAEAKVLITADGGYRRGEVFPLKPQADEAIATTPSIEKVVVVRRGNNPVDMKAGRDHWYHDLIDAASSDCPAEPMDSEQLLFLLYTSGTTGKPKGIMHTTGGYLTQVAFTHKYVFDLNPDKDIYWCTADVGWVTGHSYIVYGPLANGATSVMYEGVPNYPANDRFWSIIEKYKVSIFYTAPTAIRTFMKWGDQEPAKHDLSSLRLLGSVGEPINPEAWMWYHEHIGRGNCPIVDTWWQTETGGIMISPLPGATTLKPGSATFALPGIGMEVVDDECHHVEKGGGYLTLTQPWPAMLRGIWKDPERYQDAYWSRFEGRYFAGDGCKLDDDGYIWLLGRVDDVMNVSGHRISTTEVESALVSHPAVAEAAVVGANDATTGQAIMAYVILRTGFDVTESDLRNHVAKEIGAIAKPKAIFFTPDLPKTRSGKIMRRLLRDVAEGRNLGDTTTLADANVVSELQRRAAETPSED